MRLRSALPVMSSLLALALPLAACSGAADDRTGSTTQASMGSCSGHYESCYAIFRWLQKDAYKSTGGRTNPTWPPHTTTVMEVHCLDSTGGDKLIESAYRDNHGSAPGQLDPNGRPLLDDVKDSGPVSSTREQLLALLEQYRHCECAPATTFLSMTSARGPLEHKILDQVTGYLQQHLTCSGGTSTGDLITMLQNGNFDQAVAALSSCTWDSGSSFQDGLEQAAQAVMTSLSSDLAQYHVCNNDAMLEAQLWNDFATTGNVGTCDDTSPICAGPAWYYTP